MQALLFGISSARHPFGLYFLGLDGSETKLRDPRAQGTDRSLLDIHQL